MKCPIWLVAILGIFSFSACSQHHDKAVDELNEQAYDYHYRSLDSTRIFAEQALVLANECGYRAGRAEALNNLAFYHIGRMDYQRAYELLDSVETDNLIEMLVADVQYMRLCQRESKNKLFYDYSERAQRRINRIKEELNRLDAHQLGRVVYAESEFHIVRSTYFYYVGLTDESVEAIEQINPNGPIEGDTAQLLNYLYNVGAGGIVKEHSQGTTYDVEFSYLIRCYQLALTHGYPFFEAQALQAMSEHLENMEFLHSFVHHNAPALALVNQDNMPDTLLAGYLAQQALNIFTAYGDVYQTAGAYRTLAECYWGIRDYQSAEICLLNALEKDTAINQAPDLVASIREQLSLVYSAIDDKARSDVNRNIYLDMQEQTRQDRQLEARADQLRNSSRQLNLMIGAVLLMIGLVITLLYVFHRMRRKSGAEFSMMNLLEPLEQWKQKATAKTQQLEEQGEEILEQTGLMQQQVLQNKKRNLEQRAKVSLAYSIVPFIDRIANEVNRLLQSKDSEQVREERFAYVSELSDRINDYNDVLTRWIQMRQGDISLRIESFPLQELFDMVKRGRMSFQLKDIQLQVEDTQDVVKADRTLTLFMINTMADNARKFTPAGGSVTISSQASDNYVEVSIEDTGMGLTDEEKQQVFSHQPSAGHGFGLMNCRGIIEKYRKMSKRFSVCDIGVEDGHERGCRFFFRLPLGRTALMLLCLWQAVVGLAKPNLLAEAGRFADSAYYCNINGRYAETLVFADSCRECLNEYYLTLRPIGNDLMTNRGNDEGLPAELKWFRDSLPTNYDIIQSIRNESAVAALALHRWDDYTYNNKVYTQLFRELSADKTLADYCRMMQISETNKNVAIILLILMLLSIFPAYYMLYYRHILSYRYSVERVGGINKILLSNVRPEEKLSRIRELWNGKAMLDDDEHMALNEVVSQICQALQGAIDTETHQQTYIDMASDELRRVTFENDRLHISNNVLDNCLSTLKHETMYYPSRIRQLADDGSENLIALSEVVTYYKELYAMLLLQATRAAEGNARIDRDLFQWMLDILKKYGGDELQVKENDIDANYLTLNIVLKDLTLSDEQTSKLFTPFTSHVDFLLCRQMMRDFGEATNARGCGIQAVAGEHPTIEITLTKQIWNLLK